LRTGIFNVADMAITLGAGILVLESYRSGRHAPPSASR
jgi:lipoprotein signal peptidase